MSALPRVTIWNEGRHEKSNAEVGKIYPNGIHGTIAEVLSARGLTVRTATLDEPEHGLTKDVLAETDVLYWWGHGFHHEVRDEVVERVHQRVMEGMGLVVLHSGHYSKIFKKLMGTGCNLKWRADAEKERLWIVSPGHPIANGLGDYIELDHEEMYGEHFDIPAPDELVFVGWFQGGEVFRSGCCYFRGAGKVFYFQPGHETLPTYHNKDIQQVLYNAALWTAPSGSAAPKRGHIPQPMEKY